jgi:hypothetical protein
MMMRLIQPIPDSWLAGVDFSCSMHMTGGECCIGYIVGDTLSDSVVRMLLQEALFLSREKDHVDVRAALFYTAGFCLLYDTCFVHVGNDEFPFHVIPCDSYYELERVKNAFMFVKGLEQGKKNRCVGFALSLLKMLNCGSTVSPAIVSSWVSDVDRYGHVSHFASNCEFFGKAVFTELLYEYDSTRVLQLLDSGYSLYIELEKSTVLPMVGGGSLELPCRHAVVLLRLADSRYGLLDASGIRYIDVDAIMGFHDVDESVLSDEPWFDGCMLVGMRLGVYGMCDFASFDDTMVYSADDLAELVFEFDNEVAISAKSGEVIDTFDGDITCRVITDVQDFDFNDSSVDVQVRVYCVDVYDQLRNDVNYLHVKPNENDVSLNVVSFADQPSSEYTLDKDLLFPGGFDIKSDKPSLVDDYGFG